MGTDLMGSDGGSTYAYYLSVCGAVSSVAARTCQMISPDTSVCQVQVQGGAQTFDLGNWRNAAPPQWSFIDPAAPALGVQYNLTGAVQCWAIGGIPSPYTSTVQFQCAQQPGAVKVQYTPNSCSKTVVVPTPLACPTPPPPSPPPSTCAWNGYDLSPLQGTDLVGSDGTPSGQAYYLSVCGVLSSAAAAPCLQTSAAASTCLAPGGAMAVALGIWNVSAPPQWSFIDSTAAAVGIQYSLTGVQGCWLPGSDSGSSSGLHGSTQPFQSTVQFFCARQQSSVKVSFPANSCNATFSLATPLACPLIASTSSSSSAASATAQHPPAMRRSPSRRLATN